MRSRVREDGFTVLEVLVVVGIIGIIAGIAVPSTVRTFGDLRLHGDARAIHNMVGLAKMRAAARFTRERLYVDLTTESFHLEYWDKTAATWVADGGSVTLATGDDFSFGGMSSPPPATQATLAQAPECLADDDDPISNTACVVFNSRGIPITSTGSPDGNGAFYVTDGVTGVYAVTVSMTPLVRLWWSAASATGWMSK